jgi:hypothetical protein
VIVEPQADGSVNVRVGQYVPALVLVFEAEAAPRWFGDLDEEKVQRVIDGLSDEWRAVLTRALGEPPDDD